MFLANLGVRKEKECKGAEATGDVVIKWSYITVVLVSIVTTQQQMGVVVFNL